MLLKCYNEINLKLPQNEATLKLITSLAGLSQHFQLSCNVSTNVLHHSKPKSHCLLLSEVRKNVFRMMQDISADIPR